MYTTHVSAYSAFSPVLHYHCFHFHPLVADRENVTGAVSLESVVSYLMEACACVGRM